MIGQTRGESGYGLGVKTKQPKDVESRKQSGKAVGRGGNMKASYNVDVETIY